MSGEDKATEWWWIDYLENELAQDLECDLELLLHHSQEDRDAFENFRVLREWLRYSDPVADWPVEERLGRMRARVMREVEKERHLTLRDSAKSLSV